ncbi:hypothetical protein PIB30_010943 [Stylosanthes scabra]|uniref:Uncharacterized protein n=1 Tax=Stylosanthes scabra TaxID=79078 RepID=A0ABU6U7A5_9FABA|nr:hypothetical protein [Stylosanthes scabra]
MASALGHQPKFRTGPEVACTYLDIAYLGLLGWFFRVTLNRRFLQADEKWHPHVSLYRIIGAIVIMVGLYLVLWGKSKQKNVCTAENASLTQALLNNEEENKHADAGATPKDIP